MRYFEKWAQTNVPKKTKKKRVLNDFYMKSVPTLLYPTAPHITPEMDQTFFTRPDFEEDEGYGLRGISEKITEPTINKTGLQLPPTDVPFVEPLAEGPIETNISATSFGKVKGKAKKLLKKKYKKPLAEILLPKWMLDKPTPAEDYKYIDVAVPTNGQRVTGLD